MFLVPCCDVRYDFCIETMCGSSLPPVTYARPHVLFTLFVFVCVECCMFVLCILCCQFLWIVPSVFSKFIMADTTRFLSIIQQSRGRCGCDRMVVGFTTTGTYAINAYNH